MTLSNETTPDNEASASPLQDVEAQMRRTLGLYGAPRRPDAERAAAPSLHARLTGSAPAASGALTARSRRAECPV
jgi:hypothetical protein